jgi:hypothetical protein
MNKLVTEITTKSFAHMLGMVKSKYEERAPKYMIILNESESERDSEDEAPDYTELQNARSISFRNSLLATVGRDLTRLSSLEEKGRPRAETLDVIIEQEPTPVV